ncbi:MAG: hypothetical protein CL878_00630 [Dehalococcoidia bacterium]|nr:hypothetical protein [Dehalococcoidia bacterium]
MTTTVGEALRRAPLFKALSDTQIEQLEERVRRQHFERGDIVCYQGDPGDTFYVVVDGQVKISLMSPDGQEAILVMLDAGECFGELSLFDEQPRSATVSATEPTDVLVLRRPDFLRLVEVHPDIAVALLGLLTKRLRDTDQIVEDAAFLDIGERLAKKLLQLAATQAEYTEKGIELQTRLTQQELAAMIGATRESVNKQLGTLRDQSIIAVDRQKITILDADALRQRVQHLEPGI